MTARVKISQNVDILAKEYLVHFTVEHCQPLLEVAKMSQPFLTGKALSCIVEGGQNDSKKQSKMPVCTFGSTVKTGS